MRTLTPPPKTIARGAALAKMPPPATKRKMVREDQTKRIAKDLTASATYANDVEREIKASRFPKIYDSGMSTTGIVGAPVRSINEAIAHCRLDAVERKFVMCFLATGSLLEAVEHAFPPPGGLSVSAKFTWVESRRQAMLISPRVQIALRAGFQASGVQPEQVMGWIAHMADPTKGAPPALRLRAAELLAKITGLIKPDGPQVAVQINVEDALYALRAERAAKAAREPNGTP